MANQNLLFHVWSDRKGWEKKFSFPKSEKYDNAIIDSVIFIWIIVKNDKKMKIDFMDVRRVSMNQVASAGKIFVNLLYTVRYKGRSPKFQ